MHAGVYYVAVVWAALLVLGAVVLVVRADRVLERVLALDTMMLSVAGLLLVLSARRDSATYVDAALVLVLLAFAGTLAAVRYRAGREPFG